MNSNGWSSWVRKSSKTRPRSGGSANGIVRAGCRPLCMMHRVPVVPVFFPPEDREAIQDLACQSPSSVGWEATHWSQRSLAQAASELEYVDSIHQTTVRDILGEAEL